MLRKITLIKTKYKDLFSSHCRKSWWLFIILFHRNLWHAVGKVPINSGGERIVAIAIATPSPLLEGGKVVRVTREER
jgi:hypothetical protein